MTENNIEIEHKFVDIMKVLLDLIENIDDEKEINDNDEMFMKIIYFIKDLTPDEIIDFREFCLYSACQGDDLTDIKNRRCALLAVIISGLIHQSSSVKNKYKDLYLKYKSHE